LQRKAGNAAVAGVLRKGAKGPRVKELQELLNAAVGPPIAVDAKFGAKTCTAVRTLQKERGLQVDGAAGPDTWKALQAEAPKSTEAATNRANSAWSVAASAHSNGQWERAIAAYAEAVTQAAEAGDRDLQTVATARMREARLRKAPTPFPELVAAAAAPAEDSKEIAAKRAEADKLYLAHEHAKALPLLLAVYAESGAQSTDMLWAIGNCCHQLGRFDEAVSWYRQLSVNFGGKDDTSFALVVLERTREATLGTAPTPVDTLKQRLVEHHDGKGGGGSAKSDELRALSAEAEGLYAKHDYEGAIAKFMVVYKEAAQFGLGLIEVAYNIGMCHLHLGNFETAIEFYRQSREANRGREFYVASKLGETTGLAVDMAEAKEDASLRIAQAMRREPL
jgi:tetratricopeptide (TPR) repeat protein